MHAGHREGAVGSHGIGAQVGNGTHGPQHPPTTEGTAPSGQTGVGIAHAAWAGSQSVAVPASPTTGHAPGAMNGWFGPHER